MITESDPLLLGQINNAGGCLHKHTVVLYYTFQEIKSHKRCRDNGESSVARALGSRSNNLGFKS